MRLKIITVNTNYGAPVKNFISSLEKFNYDYIILGMGEKWGGWAWRTRKYLYYLTTLSDDTIAVLVDSDDLIFQGSPSDLIDKFLSISENGNKNKVIVGGESGCCTGIFNTPTYRKYIDQAVQERLDANNILYPNGGVLIGYKNDLINILAKNLSEPDDQAGYTRLWIENSNILELDYDCTISCNIACSNGSPNGIDKLTYNDVLNKYIYYNGSDPIILHFPGSKGDSPAYNTYNNISKQILKDEYTPYILDKDYINSSGATIVNSIISECNSNNNEVIPLYVISGLFITVTIISFILQYMKIGLILLVITIIFIGFSIYANMNETNITKHTINNTNLDLNTTSDRYGSAINMYVGGGLSNRLRPMLSAIILGIYTNKPVNIYWTIEDMDNYEWEDIFEPHALFNIYYIDHRPSSVKYNPFTDIENTPSSEIRVLSDNWETYNNIGTWWNFRHPNMSERDYKILKSHILQSLRLVPPIASKYNNYLNNIDKYNDIIGVHVRGTDFNYRFKTVPKLDLWTKEIDKILKDDPNAKFYVCSDGQQKQEIAKMYPNNVLQFNMNENNNRKTNSNNIGDSVVDLLMLNQCDKVIGTWASTFTDESRTWYNKDNLVYVIGDYNNKYFYIHN